MTNLTKTLNPLRRPGAVSLVGAGPGDPELLTIKAVRAILGADVIFYDALVSPEILEINRNAKLHYVGKRGGQKAVAQQTIEKLMVKSAKRGECVVRLKCGDPFVLGRGGEEILTLAKAGIRVEVVPGISSAIAAPGLSNIPVTDRRHTSGMLIVSGHTESAYAPVLRSVTPRTVTVVVLMGRRNRGNIARFLLAQAWPKDTQAALMSAASTGDARTQFLSLGEMANATTIDHDDGLPCTIVIGDVISVTRELEYELESQIRPPSAAQLVI